MSIFDKYQVELTLVRDMLGTNPMDPNVMDAHILDRQRKIIMEKSHINKDLNKYLDAIQISQGKGEAEIDALVDKLQEYLGYEFNKEEKAKIIAGDLNFLKEDFAELDIKGTTVFFWNKDKKLPMIGDHMILGFLKAAGEAISRTREKKNGKVLHSSSFTHSMVNQYVRVEEQFITFDKDIMRDEKGVPKYKQRSLRAITAQGPRITLAKSEVVPAGAKLSFTLKVMKNSPITENDLNDMFEYGELSGLGQWRNAGNGMFNYKMKKI